MWQTLPYAQSRPALPSPQKALSSSTVLGLPQRLLPPGNSFMQKVAIIEHLLGLFEVLG